LRHVVDRIVVIGAPRGAYLCRDTEFLQRNECNRPMTSGLDLRLEYLFDQDFEKLRCDSMEGWLAVYVVENGDPFALFESVCAPDRSSSTVPRKLDWPSCERLTGFGPIEAAARCP
jgi:hypothetical protein